MGLSQKSDKPLFLCFFFGSVSETVFKYSILREIKLLLGQPHFILVVMIWNVFIFAKLYKLTFYFLDIFVEQFR